MPDVSIHLFWALENSLRCGEALRHAPIRACGLWHLRQGTLRVEMEREDGTRSISNVHTGQWLLMPPLRSRVIRAQGAKSDAQWTSIGLSALAGGRDLAVELATAEPWSTADAGAEHGRTLATALVASYIRLRAHGDLVAAETQVPGEDVQSGLAPFECDALARALFAWLWRERGTRPFALAARGGGPAWLWRAQERAQAEPTIAIAELARASGYSDAAFRREWRRWTGVSPRDWLQAQRLDIARGLLERSDLSIAEVAHRAGFETAGQFTRVFKSRNGLAPIAYRALRREENF